MTDKPAIEETADRNTGIFSEGQWSSLAEELSLSPRQIEIVRCLFDGLTDGQIAARIKAGVPTIRTHLSRMFRSLKVHDRNELILLVFTSFRRRCRNADCPRRRDCDESTDSD